MSIMLAWLANTRTYFLFENSQVAQVTNEILTNHMKDILERTNRTVQFAIENRVSLKISTLDRSYLCIIGFCDS